MTKGRANEFGERVNALVFETSAKANIGVEELFKKITEEVSTAVLCCPPMLMFFLVLTPGL